MRSYISYIYIHVTYVLYISYVYHILVIHTYIYIYASSARNIKSNWKYTGVWCVGLSPG